MGDAHSGDIHMSFDGIIGEGENCLILVGSFWLIAGRYILYIFQVSFYVLFITIMPRSSSVLLERCLALISLALISIERELVLVEGVGRETR